MNLIVPLPQGVRDVLRRCDDGAGRLVDVHPGLILDKFVFSWDDSGVTKGLSERVQKPAIDDVVQLSQSPLSGLDFDKLLERWEAVTAKAVTFRGTTAGPFTLHLARASALENAGISLHPIYGFVYLPGSGLKGLAHSFACEVWLRAEPDRQAAWKTICRVFGTAPSKWLTGLANRLEVEETKTSSAGTVVFHDAWPTTWPKLIVDILNSHHRDYYDKGAPPGDWENPVPVYFLAVPAGQTFRFAIAPRRDEAEGDTNLAADWLAGGLTTLGAGAKTATGYGHFTVEREVKAVPSTTRAPFTTTLELVTPAFLAGANQRPQDCDLRPATLRGLLRWWWRTLHAGFVDAVTLRRLESTVWGNTQIGGAARFTLEAASGTQALDFDRAKIIQDERLPEPTGGRTTQGLTYHSYGMDEVRQGQRFRRSYRDPKASWTAQLQARNSVFPSVDEQGRPTKQGREVPHDFIINQAKAALWLLCRFGGVGAKNRKGFGCFAVPAELADLTLDQCRNIAAEFRTKCGIEAAFNPSRAGSSSWEHVSAFADLPTELKNPWLVLDTVAASAQAFAQNKKHHDGKVALAAR